MVFLDHGQNLHIHAVRANILMSFSVDFRSEAGVIIVAWEGSYVVHVL